MFLTNHSTHLYSPFSRPRAGGDQNTREEPKSAPGFPEALIFSFVTGS